MSCGTCNAKRCGDILKVNLSTQGPNHFPCFKSQETRGCSSLKFRNQEPLPEKKEIHCVFLLESGEETMALLCLSVCVCPTEFLAFSKNPKVSSVFFQIIFLFPSSLPSTHQFKHKEFSSNPRICEKISGETPSYIRLYMWL